MGEKSRRTRKIDPRRVPAGFAPDAAIPPLRVAIMVSAGNLVEHDVAEALESVGHTLMRLRYRKSGASMVFEGDDRDPGILADRVMKFGPHFILSINATGVGFGGLFPGLAEVERVPLAVWLVDFPSPAMPRVVPIASRFSLLLGYDSEHVRVLRRMGYPHVEHLPLATTPRKFPPPTAPDGADPPIRVGYAGNLFAGLIAECTSGLQTRTRTWSAEDRRRLDEMLREGTDYFASVEPRDETAWDWSCARPQAALLALPL